MVDVLTPGQRRLNMSRIRGRDTKPEMTVRRLVHSLGFRYRIHVRTLPGSPDLVFPALRKVILVHGCFWHRHECRLGQPMPKTRTAFWRKKLLRNVVRDKKTQQEIRMAGWKTLVVWQCQTRSIHRLEKSLVRFLSA